MRVGTVGRPPTKRTTSGGSRHREQNACCCCCEQTESNYASGVDQHQRRSHRRQAVNYADDRATQSTWTTFPAHATAHTDQAATAASGTEYRDETIVDEQ